MEHTLNFPEPEVTPSCVDGRLTKINHSINFSFLHCWALLALFINVGILINFMKSDFSHFLTRLPDVDTTAVTDDLILKTSIVTLNY